MNFYITIVFIKASQFLIVSDYKHTTIFSTRILVDFKNHGKAEVFKY